MYSLQLPDINLFKGNKSRRKFHVFTRSQVRLNIGKYYMSDDYANCPKTKYPCQLLYKYYNLSGIGQSEI